jgi:hypothetical protein
MMNLHRLSVFSAIVILAWASDVTQARGSSIGFHDFLKHHEGQTFGLPRLHEPLPKHVPHLSNDAVIRLWENNQYSPILRDPGIEKQLCEAVNERRNLNPARFDHYHPTLGRLLSDPQFFQYALYLYNTHTARFVHYHHHLIPIIRGCELMMMKPGMGTGGEEITVPPPAGEMIIPPPAGEMIVPPQGESIPTPPSVVLMALGIGGCRLARLCLRRVLCPS